MPKDQVSDEFFEAGLRLLRAGDKVLCFLKADGRTIIGCGDDVLPAIEDAFKALNPGTTEVEIPAHVMLALPNKDHIEKIEDWPDTGDPQ